MTSQSFITCTSTILTPGNSSEAVEQLAIETPYTVTLNEIEIGASMVLPVGLAEFGVGFLFGQGYVTEPEEVKEVIVCPEGKIAVYADVEHQEPKALIISSGCGGTGKIPRDMLSGKIEPPLETTINFKEISVFIRQVLQRSTLGPMTHCVHGCGLWSEGGVAAFYEDVGRHNAVDKIMGCILLKQASPQAAIYTTGRLTSDMVLKCARMRIPIVISRTAPSSLGLAIAQRAGITLAAYARPNRLNVFCNPFRIIH